MTILARTIALVTLALGLATTPAQAAPPQARCKPGALARYGTHYTHCRKDGKWYVVSEKDWMRLVAAQKVVRR